VRLVVGLGNPGERYAATRHNVAWRVLDRLVERWRATGAAATGPFVAHRAVVGPEPVELMRPLTYMNRAGEALEHWIHGNQGRPADLLVVTDDVYLPVGAVRMRARGSSGGHRGIESIEAALGTLEFARLRVGVGRAESSAQLREHVLEEFEREELPRLVEAVGQAADAVECWVREGIQVAMNRFNRRAPKEVQEP
jgi:PTH1 family peptidyl-tRNA hydrolase